MKNKSFILLLFTTAISLMVIALYNGFPLTEGDTGAYIEQAIYPHFAADRPPFYGLFIRITSLWTSLWFPVFAQCFILSFLVLKYIGRINAPGAKAYPGPLWQHNHASGYREPTLTLFAVIAIISFTCVPWVTAYLMPDVFAGILLLAAILYLSAPQGNFKLQGLYLLIIFLAIAMHNSHFLITAICAVLLLIASLVKKRRLMATRSIALLSVAILVWCTLCSMNAAKKYGFTFSRGQDIFIVAKLAETGILNRYLDENCEKKNLKLCNYKTQIPKSLSDFLWYENSPLYKMGGWDSCMQEYAFIKRDIFTTPRYLGMFAQKSAMSTLQELTQVQAPDSVRAQGLNSQPWLKIRQYFADEFREYNQSRQNNDTLYASGFNAVYYLFFILSSLWVLLFYPRFQSKELAFIYSFIFLFFVANAFVTSTFSSVIYRFQYRIFWILPATNAILMVKYYWGRVQNQPNT